jgi:hypothetical protein
MLMTLFVENVNAIMERTDNLASTLETLGLSREMEADQKDVVLIIEANIDSHRMNNIFEKFKQKKSIKEEESINKTIPRKKVVEFYSYSSTYTSSKSQ